VQRFRRTAWWSLGRPTRKSFTAKLFLEECGNKIKQEHFVHFRIQSESTEAWLELLSANAAQKSLNLQYPTTRNFSVAPWQFGAHPCWFPPQHPLVPSSLRFKNIWLDHRRDAGRGPVALLKTIIHDPDHHRSLGSYPKLLGSHKRARVEGSLEVGCSSRLVASRVSRK